MKVNIKNKNNVIIKYNSSEVETNSKNKVNKLENEKFFRLKYVDLYKHAQSKFDKYYNYKNRTLSDLQGYCKTNKFSWFIDSLIFPKMHINVFDTSMNPTLHPFDQSVCHRLYNRKHLSRQDVVITPIKLDNNKLYTVARRIIGLPGDAVEINKAGDVLINGKILHEPYCIKNISKSHIKLIVPKNHYFVLCDNRINNHDSRSLGFIPAKQIKYTVRYIFNDKYSYLKSISEASKLKK